MASCYSCKNFSELKEPREQTTNEGNTYAIYGYCFKKLYQVKYHKGYPVYLPEGKCEQYVRDKEKMILQQIPQQISLEDFLKERSKA